jgi:hypothetical protein
MIRSDEIDASPRHGAGRRPHCQRLTHGRSRAMPSECPRMTCSGTGEAVLKAMGFGAPVRSCRRCQVPIQGGSLLRVKRLINM